METHSAPVQTTILRTAAGSPPSVSQFRRFQCAGARIVAADSDPLSVGFFAADAAYTVPRASDPGYVDALLEVCRRGRVTAFMPALDEELVLISENRSRFEEAGTQVVLSGTDALRICTDKLAMARFFEDNCIPTVETTAAEDVRFDEPQPFPLIVKPRNGRGSAGVFVARDRDELAFFAGRYVADAVVQPKLAGLEYTIDVLADRSSEPLLVSPRKRLATDSGISSKGATAWHDEMVRWTEVIVRRLKIVGPANIQCFLSPNGEVTFTEVNARLAGTAVLTMAAGIPYAEAIIAFIAGAPIRRHVEPVAERVMLRYWEEMVLSPEDAERFGWREA
ncbi:MAG TPA: ATP-grasp domain-containing protein [Armatimonadota bacterium]|jgi:carbamoyl-phosphate synthase large subunit